jgi:AraC-like DNA-binding protein
MKAKENSNYQQIKPTNALRDFVDSYWTSNNLTNKPLKRVIFPDSFFKLVITLVDNKTSIIFLTGLWTKESEIIIPANATVYGIKFKILAPEYVFQKEIASLIDSQKMLTPSFWDIKDMQLDNLQNFVTQIELVLIKRLKINKEIQSEKLTLSKILYNKSGNILVREIGEQTFWNVRQLNRYFNKYLGVSLKKYLTIQKVYHAYSQMMMKNFSPTEGFHDQSHFIKEVKKHTNHTPKELEKEKHDRFIQLKNIQ